MATTKTQRWGILIIMIVTVVGTVGSFAVMILATKNQAAESQRVQKLTSEYQAKVSKQTTDLSAQYYTQFSAYNSRVGEFDRDSVTAVSTEDLVVGTGDVITGSTVFAAYYIGWNPKGKVFDSSIKDGALIAPLPIDSGLDGMGLIEGWKEGMKGMRIGGIREIAIPAAKAYGDQAKSDDIPANTPLKFVVMAIAAPQKPEIPKELYQSIQ